MQALTEGSRPSGRYTLRRRLGRGGMGETWLARDDRADADVVLKFAGASRSRERFHTEWRTASRLMHAHIVRVFEYHDDEERPYFAQQYVDGPSIAQIAGQPPERVLAPIGLLADALRYAHGKNVVHGDVTAANVLLDRRGAPCLIDFGMTGASGGGTPVALSPERRAGEPATAADDVYSLGVLVHELLCGEPPSADGPAERTADGQPLPSAIARLLERMLAPARADRPSAEAVVAALADAGFSPGAATLPGGQRRAAGAVDDAVEVRSVRPTRHATAAAAAPAASASSGRRGVPMPVVVGGLAVLLVAFVGVLTWLPPATDGTGRAGAPEDAAARDDGTTAPTGTGDEAAAGETPVADAPPAGLPGDEKSVGFSENRGPAAASREERIKAATDEALGDLVSQHERLRYRGIERWGGEEYEAALARYRQGDEAYVARDFAAAGEHYRATIEMLDPFFDRIDTKFRETMQAARQAFEARDHREAIRLYDLAVAITPGNAAAERGLARARTLEDVLELMRRGERFEDNLEFEAAREAYANALELDSAWQPAQEGINRVRAALEQRQFERLMTDGFNALAESSLEAARAAFEAARAMRPGSPEPAEGLLQVDQAARLARISELEQTAVAQEESERWEAAVDTYQAVLEVDGDLQFAKVGLARARRRAALNRQLEEYIDNPDSLSAPSTMQAATRLLLDLSRITPAGPRLEDQKETLSRLLKRAATPLTVELRSDNQTRVSIYQVGQLGTFDARELELRPGSYVAVGSRPGYRDVRLEFRVAPEIDMQPIVVQCEERI